MSEYNYDSFSSGKYDLATFYGPSLGTKAPDFDLATLEGNQVKLLDFPGEFLVLEMGSITCPLFQSRRKTMGSLVALFPQVSHAILYVREAHPGESIQSHENIEDKVACAQRLKRDDGEQRQILIDAIGGPAHVAYGSRPNSIFIINKNGCVVFHSDWNNPRATTKALKLLMAGKPAANVKSYFKPAVPPVVLRTLGRGGKGSAPDFFASLPSLFWSNIVKRNLALLFNRNAAVLPNADC